MGKAQANHEEIKRRMKELTVMLATTAGDPFHDDAGWKKLLWWCPLNCMHDMLSSLYDMHSDEAVRKREMELKTPSAPRPSVRRPPRRARNAP